MTIKDLKEAIKDLPDDMLVGNTGHFGEYLECWSVGTKKTYNRRRYKDDVYFDILEISIESAGDEPD